MKNWNDWLTLIPGSIRYGKNCTDQSFAALAFLPYLISVGSTLGDRADMLEVFPQRKPVYARGRPGCANRRGDSWHEA